jgi:integrase
MENQGVKFPSCLQVADRAGKLRVRSPKTESDYRRRFAGMAVTLANKLGVPHVEVDQVIEDLRGRAPTLMKRSYYLYRATILQQLRDLYVAGAISDVEAAKLVERMKPAARPVVSKTRKMSNRRRHFRPETQGALVSILSRRRSETAQNLAEMLEFGPEIGVRPCEFFGCRLEGRTLWISSAKFSEANERGIAESRPLELLQLNDHELKELANLIERLNLELQAVGGNRTQLVRRYSALMRRTRDLVSTASRLTIGSTRHQFRANLAKAGYSREEVAAAMGHAVATTAETHYGHKSRGWSLKENRRPISVPANLVARVRPGTRAKSRDHVLGGFAFSHG